MLTKTIGGYPCSQIKECQHPARFLEILFFFQTYFQNINSLGHLKRGCDSYCANAAKPCAWVHSVAPAGQQLREPARELTEKCLWAASPGWDSYETGRWAGPWSCGMNPAWEHPHLVAWAGPVAPKAGGKTLRRTRTSKRITAVQWVRRVTMHIVAARLLSHHSGWESSHQL